MSEATEETLKEVCEYTIEALEMTLKGMRHFVKLMNHRTRNNRRKTGAMFLPVEHPLVPKIHRYIEEHKCSSVPLHKCDPGYKLKEMEMTDSDQSGIRVKPVYYSNETSWAFHVK